MIHWGLTSSSALFGLYDVFRWQKDALFATIGYAYTFPISHSMAEIRKTIEMAIANLALYCDTLPEAGPVVAVARTLADDVEAAISGFYGTSSWPSSLAPSRSRTPPDQFKTQVLAGPPIDVPMSGAHDISMIPTTTSLLPNGEFLDFDFMLEPSLMHANWDAMDDLWSSLVDPSGGPQVDHWSATAMKGL
jgi:hypothetical protein